MTFREWLKYVAQNRNSRGLFPRLKLKDGTERERKI